MERFVLRVVDNIVETGAGGSLPHHERQGSARHWRAMVSQGTALVLQFILFYLGTLQC